MNWQELSDRKLVELCLEGNEDAWAEFLRRYSRLIAGVIAKTLRRSYIPSQDHIHDIQQNALRRILENDCRALRKLEWLHDGSLRGLLQITASTAAQDHIRERIADKRDIHKEVSIEEPGLVVPVKEKFTEKAEQKIFIEHLVECLQKLLHGEADCTRSLALFLLYYEYGVTAPDLSRLYRLDKRKVENTVARLGRLARSHCL